MGRTFSVVCFANFHCLFFIDPPNIPETDLIFALSANAAKDHENFQQMKDIIETMIDKYGTSRLQYAVITFGNVPRTAISFNGASRGDEALKRLVNSIRKSSGGRLDKALEEAKLLFEARGRPNAKRVVVVITDKKSESSAESVKNQGKVLENNNIKVVPVLLGKESDANELRKTTPNKENLVPVDEGDDPVVTAEIILRKAIEGNLLFGLVFLRLVYLSCTLLL